MNKMIIYKILEMNQDLQASTQCSTSSEGSLGKEIASTEDPLRVLHPKSLFF